jgi:hypothetical protein
MFAKWFEEYQRYSERMRFLSKLSAFLVSLFAILSLYNIAYFFYIYNYGFNTLFEIHNLFPAAVFQFAIFLIFALKFALLFFKSKKAFIFDQILWLTGIILLLSYWYFLRLEPRLFGIYSTVTEPFFRHSSPIFSSLAMLYLILSPLRQITTIIIAWIKSK